MWINYFRQIQNKYSMRVSLNKPLIVRLDGKNVTKNKSIDLISMDKSDFNKALKQVVEVYSAKYNCISIFGSDEVNFIFSDPNKFIEDIDSNKNNSTDEIISMFSQYFFDFFNSVYKKEKIFWHGRCFSINNEKINSYVKFRSQVIRNVMTTYFLKKNNIKDAGRIKLDKKIEICKEYDGYEKTIKKIENGVLYKNGERIDIEEFLKGNIKVIEQEEKNVEDKYFDITKWDI